MPKSTHSRIFGLIYFILCLILNALLRKVDNGILHPRAAAVPVISPFSQRRYTSSKFPGKGFGGRPKRTPFAFAAAIPSACRWRILIRSFSATKDNTCNTISLRKVPIRSFPRRVSSSGISKTIMSMPLSFVRIRHCANISS